MRRYFVDSFFQNEIEKLENLPSECIVLDLGGYKDVKRGFFDINGHGLNVLTLNISAEKGADLLSDAVEIALSDMSIDVIVCSEVLEHVRNPVPVLREVRRVLKHDGILLATIPFLFHIHADPFDFGRYTDRYWEENLREMGFQSIQIERQGLFYSVITNFVEQYLRNLHLPRPFGRIAQTLFALLIINPMKRVALWREAKQSIRTDKFMNSFTTGFSIRATKLNNPHE
jgi:ubiquinone/menaquinone biosynthesis C-methylase UbiE